MQIYLSMQKIKSPLAIIILDGFGIQEQGPFNAVATANTPHLTTWKTKHSYTTLDASGSAVGLLPGQQGNSEVGHFTIGAGTIVEQTATKLASAFKISQLINNNILIEQITQHAPTKIHIIGLISDGGVHGHIDHLLAMIQACHTLRPHAQILVHAITDGRDRPPQSCIAWIEQIQTLLTQLSCGHIATIGGRFYAMDRDNNQERLHAATKVMFTQQTNSTEPVTYIHEQYAQKIFDEQIVPHATHTDHVIEKNSFVIMCNFRPDRAKQLAQALLEEIQPTCLITPVLYDENIITTPLLAPIKQPKTLLEVLDAKGYNMFTCAETEKFAHVTYFFNGYKNISLRNETRKLIPSIKTDSYAKFPRMSALDITQAVLDALEENIYDVFLINYANADMVGHTGNFTATVQAIECLDEELKKLYEEIVLKRNGQIIITADHGNAEVMFDAQFNQPCTSHTTSKVPLYHLSNQQKKDISFMTGLKDVYDYVLKNLPSL